MEAQAAFVRAEGAVEFNPEAAVDLNNTIGIDPWHAKDDLAFRFADAFNDLVLGKLRVLDQNRAKRFENFAYGLMKFNFTWIAAQNFLKDRFDFFI